MTREDTNTYEIKLLTTDAKFVDDMNAADIRGLRAVYRPEMAFDSWEHLCQIVVEAASAAALKAAAEWIFERAKKAPPRQIIIGNKDVQNSQIVNVVNVYLEREKQD